MSDDGLSIRSVQLENQLEKLRFALDVPISEELIDTTIDFRDAWLVRMVIAEIRGHVWAEKLETKQVRYPADWWQAFKARWFPPWAKKRWPVRYAVVQWDLKALYPHFRPSIPRERSGGAVFRVFESFGETPVGWSE